MGPNIPSLPSSSYEVVHSSRLQGREVGRSRHAMSNINLLRDAAISSGGLTINPDTVMQHLASNSTWTNKDLILLLLAVNDIISSDIPNETQEQPVDEISDHIESDKE